MIFVNFPRGKTVFLKATSIDSIEREMAPPRRRTMTSRHLVCESCSCWVQFDSSGCRQSWADMTGVRVSSRAWGVGRWQG